MGEPKIAGKQPVVSEIEPGTYNLVGFPMGGSTHEAVGLLGELGLKLNRILLPASFSSEPAEIFRAQCHVFLENVHYEPYYERLKSFLRSPWLRKYSRACSYCATACGYFPQAM